MIQGSRDEPADDALGSGTERGPGKGLFGMVSGWAGGTIGAWGIPGEGLSTHSGYGGVQGLLGTSYWVRGGDLELPPVQAGRQMAWDSLMRS